MFNMGNMMKQAQKLQQQVQEVQERIGATNVIGQSGGGVVEINLNGKHEMLNIKIDPSLLVPGEADILEDLIIAAYKDAFMKIENIAATEMKKVTGGMSLPGGLKLPF